jgi:uncharacterized protein (UPF0276 family)
MIKLAVNVSETLLSLIDGGEINVDYIKVPLSAYPGNLSVMREARKRRPMLLHPLETGIIDLAKWTDEEAFGEEPLAQMINLTETPSLSTHVCMKASDLNSESKRWTGVELRKRVIGKITHNANLVQAFIKRNNLNIPLLLENYPSTPKSGNLPFTATPEFLNEVTAAANAELLIDTAHARVNAWFMGIDVFDMLERFDLNRVGELHVAGPRFVVGQGLSDMHTHLEQTDYELLEWLLHRTKPRIISLEYGGMGDTVKLSDGNTAFVDRNNPAMLKAQIQNLQTLISSF